MLYSQIFYKLWRSPHPAFQYWSESYIVFITFPPLFCMLSSPHSWYVHGPLPDAISCPGPCWLSGLPQHGHGHATYNRHGCHDGSERGSHDGAQSRHDGRDDNAQWLHGKRARHWCDGHGPKNDGTTGWCDACRHGACSRHVRHPAWAAGSVEHGSGMETVLAVLVNKQLHTKPCIVGLCNVCGICVRCDFIHVTTPTCDDALHNSVL